MRGLDRAPGFTWHPVGSTTASHSAFGARRAMAEASTKRRRVAQEAASGASGANQGASSGGASEGVVADAAAMTKESPKLDMLGRHVHRLGRCIISFEAFVLCRYKNGRAHEPNPDDPLEVARHTIAVARATALVAEVPMIPLKGSIAKSHLLSFLQCLKAGNIYWSDTGCGLPSHRVWPHERCAGL